MAESTERTSTEGPSAQAGAAAGRMARQAFEEWRQRMAASRHPAYGPAPFPPGPSFGGGPFPMPPGFGPDPGFPPGGWMPAPPAATGAATAAAGSLFSSLSTMLRLAVDLINSNLQSMLPRGKHGGMSYGHGRAYGGGCGCDCGCCCPAPEPGCDCCQCCGPSCGCCHPSVTNCC